MGKFSAQGGSGESSFINEGMRISASMTKVMWALITGEQRQAVSLDGEPPKSVNKLKYLDSMFIANGQSTTD